jgi:hypothetical protein
MNKKTVILAIVVFAAMGAYRFSRGYLKAALQPPGSREAMRAAALELNRGLPKTIDPDLQLVFASGDDHLLSFHYKVVTRAASEVAPQDFVARVRERLVTGTCSDPDLQKRFLAHGTTVQHVFRGNDDLPIATIDVRPGDCPAR